MLEFFLVVAPLLHSLEQVLTKKPEEAAEGLDFDYRHIYPTLDGEHVYRWLFVAAYAGLVLTWDLAWYWVPVYVVCGLWFLYNIGYHILWIKVSNRPFWRCFPPAEFVYFRYYSKR